MITIASSQQITSRECDACLQEVSDFNLTNYNESFILCLEISKLRSSVIVMEHVGPKLEHRNLQENLYNFSRGCPVF